MIQPTTNRTSGGVQPSLRWVVFAALALVALAIRLPQLGQRPMHTDESVNAYIVGDLLAGEGFHYDPQDRHGPLLYALAEPVAKLCGARTFSDLTEIELRLTPALLGGGTVMLFGAGVELFGFIPCLVAGLLFAFAPLPVYYNRYFIHETPMVAATLGLMLAGGWALGLRDGQKKTAQAAGSFGADRPGESRGGQPASVALQGHTESGSALSSRGCNSDGNALIAAGLAGFCGALMLACKETAVIHFFALGVAAVLAWWLPPREKIPSPRQFAVAVLVFVFTTALLFTWFGRNPHGLADLWRAVPGFVARAGGEGHEKPFGYYTHLLDPTMVLFIVAFAGGYAAICDAVEGVRKPRALLVAYGLVLFIGYSAIPYKTPWLALNLWLPLALTCGFGADAIWAHTKTVAGKRGWGLAGAFLLAMLAVHTKVLAFDHPADEKNPLAYAHTGYDLLKLPPRLAQLARDSRLSRPQIAVVAADPWPLPWYLRKFSCAGYWQPGQQTGPADFIITSEAAAETLGDPLRDFRPEYFGVRPGVLCILWIPAGTNGMIDRSAPANKP